jgi:hypothetical protein
MNDLLKSKLEVLASDELTLRAIQEVINSNISKIMPEVDKTTDNQTLGEKYRAFIEAERIIRGAMEDISSYKTQRSSNNQINKGK